MADKKVQEKNDVLLEIGKEGKEGIKNFKEYAKDLEAKEKKKKDITLEKIDSAPKKKFSYNRFLSELLIKHLKTVDWSEGWWVDVAPTERGVVMELKSPDGRIFRSAFKSTADPIADLNAVEMFTIRAENTVDEINNPLSEEGIWLPKRKKRS